MRTSQKRDILEMINTLHEAHDIVRNDIEAKQYVSAQGMWHGNDTIWRTILDINKIVYYADKKGEICTEEQRKVLHFGDMIVCGDKKDLCDQHIRGLEGFYSQIIQIPLTIVLQNLWDLIIGSSRRCLMRCGIWN